MKTAVLGGTFHTLHGGHKLLLAEALRFGRILIGLTTDAYAKKMRVYPCAKYAVRKAALEKFLKSRKALQKTKIIPISDRFGPAAKSGGIDAIIVSEETSKIAERINSARKRRGLKRLEVIVVPILRAEDDIRISCTRVHEGKISLDGKRKRPLVFSLGTKNPVKIKGAKAAAKKAFGKIACKFIPHEIMNHAPEQPIGFAQVWKGARKRARLAFGKSKCDYGVGLESGLIKFGSRFYDIQFCCLYDGYAESGGCSMGFPLPEKIIGEIRKQKKPMGDVVSRISGIRNIGRKGGALAFLSRGLLHRRMMVEQAMLCALVERRSPV